MTDAADTGGTARAARPWKRYLKIGLPILVVLGAAFWFFWPRWAVELEIRGLHNPDARARRAHLEALESNGDPDLVIDCLLDAVQDDDYAFEVRKICADLLHEHFHRLGALEKILRTGSLPSRCVVLRSLMVTPFFKTQVAGDPAYRVRETVHDWLARKGDMSRTFAIQIAVQLEIDDVLPAIRPLVARSGRANVPPREERNLMIAAAGALGRLHDCQQLPRLLPIATNDPDALVRLRFMQVLETAAFRPAQGGAAPCAGAVDEAAMQSLLGHALDDTDHAVRMGALLILARHAPWARSHRARIRQIYDGDATGAERRHALEALVAAGDEGSLATLLPQACHDPAGEVRVSAARAIAEHGQGLHLEECWIGFVEEETQVQLLFNDALDDFQRFAHDRVGFPEPLKLQSVNDKTAFRQTEANLFAGAELNVAAAGGGVLHKVSRHTIAEAMFRWWCDKRGLSAADTEKAVAARRAFYAAKARGDHAAAKAALDGAGLSEPQGLFAYERAWQ